MLFDRDEAPKVLTAEQEEIVHRQAMRILAEIGIDVLHADARKLLAEAGQRVDGDRVYWDPAFVLEQAALAPSTFMLHARNPEKSIEVGGGTPLWMNVGGPPFFSDLDG